MRSLSFGARYSDRTKDHDRFESLPQAAPGGVQIPADLFTVYQVDSVNIPPVLLGDFDAIAAVAYGPGAFDSSNATENLSQKWEVNEEVVEAYLKAGFDTEVASRRVTGNVGVRFVDVKTTSDGYQQATGASALEPVSIEHDYTEALPSANLNFRLADDKLLRFGVARVIARPPLDELRASRTLTNWLPYTGNAGNPDLEPFKANQVDVSYEWYFHEEALTALAVFCQDVDSYIGWPTGASRTSAERPTPYRPR